MDIADRFYVMLDQYERLKFSFYVKNIGSTVRKPVLIFFVKCTVLRIDMSR
jgi:hypothetical protein